MTMSPAAEAARRGGADGIAAINTIKSLIVTDEGRVAVGGLSGKAVKPIALRFIAELGENENLKGMHISAMGGMETWRDAVEFLLLGANHVQITTSVMQYGARIIDDLLDGLRLYLRQKALTSVSQLQGLGVENVKSLDHLERDSVLLPRFLRDRCIGCGRCYLSCRDGGHEAIEMRNGQPTLNPKKCVGCHLCILVCPQKAIRSSGKRI